MFRGGAWVLVLMAAVLLTVAVSLARSRRRR
jgi:hypothetical protein